MIELTRSRTAMAMTTVAASLWALAAALGGLAYVVLNDSSDTATRNLLVAGAWLAFVAGMVLLSATCVVTWHLFVQRAWPSMWECAGAAVSTLLLTIGLLILAFNAPSDSAGADITSAIGIGGWAIVLVVGAARRALEEQESGVVPIQSGLRMFGAIAVVLLAIAIGLPQPDGNDRPLAIAGGIIYAAGFGGLAYVVTKARDRHFLTTRHVNTVILGLWVLTAAGLARSAGSGFLFGPSLPSLLTFRLAIPLPELVYVVGTAILAWAAFSRMAEVGAPVSAAPSGPAGIDGHATTPAMAPASWLPDPAQRHQLRWWDGAQWSAHVLDDNQPAVDPI